MAGECARADTVLAGQILYEVEPLPDLGQVFRIRFQRIEIAAQIAQGIVAEFRGRLERPPGALERRMGVIDASQYPDGPAHVIGLRQDLHRPRHGFPDALPPGQAPELGFQRFEFSFQEVQLVEFGKLIAQQFAAVAGLGEAPLQFPGGLPGPPPGPVGFGHGFTEARRDSVGVQQRELHLFPDQALVFVLAVNVHHVPRQLAQGVQVYRRTVDERPRPAVAADDATQEAPVRLIGIDEFSGAQTLANAGDSADVEFGAHFRLPRALTDQSGTRALAEHQGQRIQQYGLAGAGFAGYDRETAVKRNIQRAHQRKVGNGELLEQELDDRRKSHIVLERIAIAPDTSAMAREQADDRAEQLFKLLVECYIDDGRPVASRALAQKPTVHVSAATVRNIMARLEGRGLVKSPHTSAGKIPTSQGLRFFVDSLLSVEPLDEAGVHSLESQLNSDMAPSKLVESASKLLALVTEMTGVVTLPRRDAQALRHVEFLNLDGDRVLVILVYNDREVQNRVIHVEKRYDDNDLLQASNYLNREFGGLSLEEIRQELLGSMQRDKDRMDRLLQAALDLASQAFEPEESEERSFVVSGESKLLDMSEDTETVRSLFEAFSRKGSILHLLDQSLNTQGIQLYIGEESGYRVLDELSLVTSSYTVNGRIAGVLGVVGPTRMAYQRVIPVVDMTARMLGNALRHP